MNYILFDEFITRKNMLPLTFVRPVADLRFGILTMREKWEHFLGAKTSTLTENYLLPKYPIHEEDENILINASFQPEQGMVDMIRKLKINQSLVSGDHIIAMCTNREGKEQEDIELVEYGGNPLKLNYPWDLFMYNDVAIRHDFPIVTKGRKSAGFGKGTHVIAPENVFVEEGAMISHATINATNGLVYIGKQAEIMEGALIRGSFALCDHAVVKMGARIYGATTIGPWCKVGGELDNVIFLGYSNKAHDGFMGNSVIGEWCNIGSGTSSSNLKNSYDIVKVWNYYEQRFIDTGLQFERPQHRIVQERAALGHHLVTELGAVTHLHHLVQGVADHRVAQSGGDIADRGALLLSLLDRGIHEDGAAAAQVDRRR